jgi:uncharacterized protein (TIGR00297 family)
LIGLSKSGLIAAAFVGVVTIWIGHWQGALVLFAFFIPSTLLSRAGKARKRELVDIGKLGARDAMQVLANGGVATFALLLEPYYGAAMFAAFAGAYAAAAADTWATEIGTLARATPRSILTFKPLATGLSGGITLQGSLAQIAGAAFVALVAALVHVAPFVPVVIAGVAGSLADSLLGATLQSLRWCPRCERACETDPHVCGSPTQLRRGLQWFDNDAVNFACTLVGSIVGAVL